MYIKYILLVLYLFSSHSVISMHSLCHLNHRTTMITYNNAAQLRPFLSTCTYAFKESEKKIMSSTYKLPNLSSKSDLKPKKWHSTLLPLVFMPSMAEVANDNSTLTPLPRSTHEQQLPNYQVHKYTDFTNNNPKLNEIIRKIHEHTKQALITDTLSNSFQGLTDYHMHNLYELYTHQNSRSNLSFNDFINYKPRTISYAHIFGVDIVKSLKKDGTPRVTPDGNFKIIISGHHHDCNHILEKSGLVCFCNKKDLGSDHYQADLSLLGATKKNNSYFPARWPIKDVIQHICTAFMYPSKVTIERNYLVVESEPLDNTIKIKVIVNQLGTIITAYPIKAVV